ncbi:MAG: AMP-binding protein, partial [Myxococcales bacterium]|nr:AMP-binding protein [Myxococcales bacterium]
GAPGELWLGGEGLSPGYLHDPERTRSRFVEMDPGCGPRRLYRTGDRARWNTSGYLEFLGRVDNQVKLRGFRIELGEVETAMEAVDGVAQAVAMVRSDDGSDSLVAYYVAETGRTAPPPKELRAALRQTLPVSMLPAHLVVMDSLPTTVGGKVDRKMLPAPERQEVSDAISHEAPRDLTEKTIADVWSEVLGIERIGIHDNFFELGGHSLQSMRVLERANRMGLRLAPADFFRSPTIAGLAEAVQVASTAKDLESLITLQPEGERTPIYFTHSLPGDLLGYGALVHRLGSDQPCYGLQSLGLLDPTRAHTSITGMADYYAELVHTFQPEGPLHLVGWCFGSHIAFEMARALERRGRKVTSIAMLEAFPALTREEYLVKRLSVLRSRGLRGAFRYAAERLQGRGVEVLDREGQFALEARSGVFEHRMVVYEKNMTALREYHSAPYEGRVLLVRVKDQPAALLPDDYGWGELIPNLEIAVVDSAHEAMVQEPHVGEVADILRRWHE